MGFTVVQCMGVAVSLLAVNQFLVPLLSYSPAEHRKARNLDILELRPYSARANTQNSLPEHASHPVLANISSSSMGKVVFESSEVVNSSNPAAAEWGQGGDGSGNATLSSSAKSVSPPAEGRAMMHDQWTVPAGEGSHAGSSSSVSESVGEGATERDMSRSQRVAEFLFIACFAFGGYLVFSLVSGRQSGRLLRGLRMKLFVFRKKHITGVHVVETVLSVLALMCVEAATLIHHRVLVPLLMCWDADTHRSEGCRGWAEYLIVHVVPSAWIHLCFYFNWYMCIFGTNAADAAAKVDGGGEEGGTVRPVSELATRARARGDSDHWSVGGSLVTIVPEQGPGQGWDSGGERSERGPLGTDGDALRGHFCRVCEAYVIRSDHHCPFLGVCVGAHNHGYFLGLLLYMTMGMAYGSCLIVPAAFSCFLHHRGSSRGTGDAGRCELVVPIAVAVVFVAGILVLFFWYVLMAAALNLTTREIVSLQILRFRMGPCGVWAKIWRRAAKRANLCAVLGGQSWRDCDGGNRGLLMMLARLLLPMRRPVAACSPLDLPSEEELSEGGVWWHVSTDGLHFVQR